MIQADSTKTPIRPKLDTLFTPRNVAVIGATETEGSVGRTILWNLITNPFGGTVYPVNPKRQSVLGIKAYPTIADVPAEVDLAVIVIPARFVPGAIEECIAQGVQGAIIISAGFKEIGEEGAKLEQRILELARGKMRIIGPNCLGVMRPMSGLNATFAGSMARPGNVAFISQSGAICTAVLDWSFNENVGFSAFISIGSMLDVGWGDLIYYLDDDPHTKSIVIYMESIGDARAFLSAAREVALSKPIIVIKAGRTEAAAKAAASHTGSLAGSDEVLDAAFRRSGVLRVDRIADIFYMSETLAKQPHPRGNCLTILTNAGGPGVLATDSLIMGGGKLAELSDETMTALNELLPEAWSHNNPIDILGDADPERYAKALEIAAADPNSHGLLVILTPQDMTDPTQTAEQLKPFARINGKPVLASWMGGAEIEAGNHILNRAGIPTFEYPDTATRLFNYMWKYSYNLRALYETPVLPDDGEDSTPDRETVEQIIQHALTEKRSILTEAESKQILAAYHIPTTPMAVAESADNAVQAAEEIGYPVVLKLHSKTVTHKTDVGGVQLNLQTEAEVRAAFDRIREGVTAKHSESDFLGVSVQPMAKLDGYELIVGSSLDVQFGPVLLFGTGGTLVEVFKDRALGLPPLNSTLARRMMEQTKIYAALKGFRGRAPVDMDALEQLLVRFSQLVVEQRWIKEIDINPLLASADRLLALDARVVLHDADTPADKLPKLAIRPYPTQYIAPYITQDGEDYLIRPIRPEDEPMLVTFHQQLSPQTVYMRYFSPLKLTQRVTHERLSRICFIDYDREIALVAERVHPDTGIREIAAIGRLSKSSTVNEAEFGITVSDPFQGKGLGTEIMRRLVDVARAEKLDRFIGYILPDNTGMLHLAEQLGFNTTRDWQENVVRAVINFTP